MKIKAVLLLIATSLCAACGADPAGSANKPEAAVIEDIEIGDGYWLREAKFGDGTVCVTTYGSSPIELTCDFTLRRSSEIDADPRRGDGRTGSN